MRESKFQSDFIKRVKDMFGKEHVISLKNDSSYMQGIADWTIIVHDKVFFLEMKNDINASHRPNQQYYVDWFRAHGHNSCFCYPQNEERVIRAIYLTVNEDANFNEIVGGDDEHAEP